MQYNPFSLKEKTILVTGASSGIGKSCAIEISKMGASVLITGRDHTRLSETFGSLYSENNKLIVADISTDSGIQNLVQSCTEIDGIIHAAGVANPKPFNFIGREYMSSIMDTNFVAPVLLTQKLYKNKLLKKSSSVVFISSISGNLIGSLGNSIYSASKGAINGVTKGMALEFAKRKIRVNTIMPGMIDTGIFDNSSISTEDLENDMKKYPLGRYGNVEDIAYLSIYLLSDTSLWVTGSNFLIDGGFTLV